MSILVLFTWVLSYSAGNRSSVSLPVLCMVVQVGGRCVKKYDVKNKTFFQMLRAIYLDEL